MKRFLQTMISAILLACLLAGAMPEPFVASSAAAIEALAEEAKAHPVAEISALAAGAEERAATTDGDGWIYRICPDGYAELIGYADAAATSLALPDALGGAWVVRLAEGAFADNPNLRSVTIPAQIDEIPDSAFPNGEGMTVRAYNGTAALAFAAKRGFEAENRSTFDLFDDVLDLSEMASSQWSLSGSALRLEEPYSRLAKDGRRLYLPPQDEYPNGMAVELSECRTEGSGAVARYSELSFAEAIESYHAEDVRLYPDLSSFRSYSEGVELVTKPQARAVGDETFKKSVYLELNYKLNKYLSVNGNIEVSTSVTVSVDYKDYEIHRLEYENTSTTAIGAGLTLANEWDNNLNLPQKNIPKGEVGLGGFRLVGNGVVSAWLELSLVFTAEGNVSVETSITTTDRFTYIDGEVKKGHTHDVNPPSWSAQVGGSVALKGALAVRLGLDWKAVRTAIDVMELALSLGLEGAAEVDFDNACIDVEVDSFYRVTFEIGLLGAQVLGKDLEWEEDSLFNQFKIGSTLKEFRETLAELHFESDDGKMTGKWSRVPKCTRDRVTVHFYPGYGSAVPDQEVRRGDTLKEPSIASRDGYSFQGWYTDPNHVTPWDFANDYVQQEMTLYAYWVKDPEPGDLGDMTVQPDVEGQGHGVVYFDQSYVYDALICRQFEYDYVPGGVEITSYSPVLQRDPDREYTEEEDRLIIDMFLDMSEEPYHVTVPSTIDGLPVVKIGGYILFRDQNITGVTLPDTVREIESQALAGCSMSSIRLSANLKELPDYAFFNCGNLTSITIPAGVARIGMYAFDGCTKLANVTLSEGLKEIVERAFWGCSNLRRIALPDSVTHIGIEAFGGDEHNGDSDARELG